MRKRHKMDRSRSEKYFTNTAKTHHPMNNPRNPMRGGIRL